MDRLPIFFAFLAFFSGVQAQQQNVDTPNKTESASAQTLPPSQSTAPPATVPTRVPSFGPNGTHWPHLIPTPFLYDRTVPNIVEIPLSWTAISEAIDAVTPEQAAAGTLILLEPGTLATASNSRPSLQNLGSAAWSKRVTIAPRDGFGSVTFTGGVRIEYVHGVCFAGLKAGGFRFKGCKHSALAWTSVSAWVGFYGASDIVTDRAELCEVVHADSSIQNSDACDLFTGGGDLRDILLEGCYYAPHFYDAVFDGPNSPGARPHTDTLQFASPGGGNYSDFTIRDGAYFSSNNCAIQTGDISRLHVDHSYIAGAAVARSRYPFLSGGSSRGGNNAFNGSGSDFTSTDSVFLGGLAFNRAVWKSVSNTRTDRDHSGGRNAPTSGAWTYDPDLDETNSDIPPYPTEAYLAGIWADNEIPPAEPETAPERTPSFGANGTHWPDLIPTPFLYERTPHDITVNANWPDIAAAIATVTDEMANAGVRILIKPGTLTGYGAGGGDQSVLGGLGSDSWTKRITVCPRDGYGTINVVGGAKIYQVQGICFAGFIFDSVKLEGCHRGALAWSKVESWLATYGNKDIPVVDKLELAEVVMPDAGDAANQDRSDQYSNFSNCTNWRYDGCYLAPRYYLDNSLPRPHIDTMQFGPIPAGSWFDVTIRDTVAYPSNNCAINGGFIGATFDHILVLGGRDLPRTRYPVPPGGEDGEPNGNGDTENFPAFNGTGRDITIKNSFITGGLTFNEGQGAPIWANVTNTTINHTPSGKNIPATGAWTTDTNRATYADLEPPYPTDAYLINIWTKNGIIPGDTDPDTDPPAVPQNVVATATGATTANLTWSASSEAASYSIYIDGNFSKNSTGTSTQLTGLSPDTTYLISVSATDTADNESAQSTAAEVTTGTAPPVGNLDSFLVAHWPFDGNTDDRIGNYDGTPSNGPTFSGSGQLGGAISFDGNDDRVDAGVIDIPGSTLTLAAWVRPETFDGFSNEARFISKATTTNGNDHFWMLGNYGDGTALRFRLKTGTSSSATTTLISPEGQLPLGEWSHVAATYDGSTMRIFLNGTQIAEIGKTGALATNGSVNVGLGNQPVSSHRPLDGMLDDARIYNKALSATELASIMVPPTPFDTWVASYDNLPTGDDGDHDGIPLLMEYALGTSPVESTTSPISIEIGPTSTTLTFPKMREELTYTVETSPDLGTWNTNGVTQPAAALGEMEIATIAPTTSRMFIRLKVTQ